MIPFDTIKPGQQVRVTQVIDTRDERWQTQVEGEVLSLAARPTGSWFAHGKNDKYWLPRLRLKREDGELVDLVLDEDSRVDVIGAQ